MALGSRAGVGGILCVLGVIALGVSIACSYVPAADRVVYAGQSITIGPAESATWKVGDTTSGLVVHEQNTDAAWVSIQTVTGLAELVIQKPGTPTRVLKLRVICGVHALLAGVGALLLLFGLPTLWGNRAWTELLSEKGGGLSLAKTQLLIWFCVSIVILAGTCIPVKPIPDISSSLGILLGLGGITTALGAVASPLAPAPPAGTPAAPTPPAKLVDLVTDWKDQADMSRYQYLIITILGAFAILFAFASHLVCPEIPTSFFYVIVASQATYLGTKVVKATTSQAAA